MSPIVIIVFAPVVIAGLVFYAVLLGAAAGGVWEAAEARAERNRSGRAPSRSRAASPGPPSARTARLHRESDQAVRPVAKLPEEPPADVLGFRGGSGDPETLPFAARPRPARSVRSRRPSPTPTA